MNQIPPLRLTKHGSPHRLPREPLSPKQQLQALRLVQDQAEQRVNLGIQLFKAAQAHTIHQQELIAEIKSHQEKMRQEMQHDIASSLQTYDQWMATFDENFTRKLQQLEKTLDQKINTLNGKWESIQKRILEMVSRSETLLNQSRDLLKAAAQPTPPRTRRTKPPTKPANTPANYAIVVPPTQKLLPRPKKNHGTPQAHQATPPAPKDSPAKDTAEHPDMIFSKALKLLKANDAKHRPV